MDLIVQNLFCCQY